MPVVHAREAHRARESAWAVEARVLVEAQGRLARPHEHRVSTSRARAGHVEALVHPVDEEHVRVSLRPEQSACPAREPCPRVRRQILGAAVRFGLDDARDAPVTASRSALAHDVAADERAGDHEGVAREPGSLEPRGAQLGEVDRPRHVVRTSLRRPGPPRATRHARGVRGRPRPLRWLFRDHETSRHTLMSTRHRRRERRVIFAFAVEVCATWRYVLSGEVHSKAATAA